MRNECRYFFNKLVFGYCTKLPPLSQLTMQQLAIVADKHVSLLGENLRPPITLLLETQIPITVMPALEHADMLLLVLQHKDNHHHAVVVGDHRKHSTLVKQVHSMRRIHNRWDHLASGSLYSFPPFLARKNELYSSNILSIRIT